MQAAFVGGAKVHEMKQNTDQKECERLNKYSIAETAGFEHQVRGRERADRPITHYNNSL